MLGPPHTSAKPHQQWSQSRKVLCPCLALVFGNSTSSDASLKDRFGFFRVAHESSSATGCAQENKWVWSQIKDGALATGTGQMLKFTATARFWAQT